MAEKPDAHPALNEQENIIAVIGGIGLTLMVVAGTLDAFTAGETFLGMSYTATAIIGLILTFIAFLLWLVVMRPYEEMDDLKTPLYTGHHHDDDHHDDHDSSNDQNDTAKAVAEALAQADRQPTRMVDLESLASEFNIDVAPAEVVNTLAEKPPELAAVVTEAEPIAEDAPDPDDLTIIEGIGAKSAEALNAAGITTFADLADRSQTEIDNIIKDAGVRVVGSTASWNKQAQYAANGDIEGLSRYQDDLKGGEDRKDDLTKIEGIGAKSEAALNASGITTYRQVAELSGEELTRIVKEEHKVRLVGDAATWSKQAQYFVDGDLTGLKAYQDRLVGGREVD